MNAYLETQLPYLQTLHQSLGLNEEDYTRDLQDIDKAIRLAIDAKVNKRKEAVEELKQSVTWAKEIDNRLRTALGEDEQKEVDCLSQLTLPDQLESIKEDERQLRATYDQRMARISALQDEISSVIAYLGHSPAITPDLQERACLNDASSCTIVTNSDGKQESVQVASFSRILALEEVLHQAQLEKAKKQEELKIIVDDLRFLHGELHISSPEGSTASDAWFIPDPVSSESIATNVPLLLPHMNAPSSEDLPPLKPTDECFYFCKMLRAAWQAERTDREERIQKLFDQIEPIWLRLEIPEEEINEFVNQHGGLSLHTLQAYELERDRVIIMRNASLEPFIKTARMEIENLWTDLLYGEKSRQRFCSFYDDEISEDVLLAHENETKRLKDELANKQVLLAKAREWMDLKAQEDELEAKRNGPDRFNTRGGKLLLEEKMRKRLGILRPKMEAELLRTVPEWEAEHGMEFLIDDIRLVEVIMAVQQSMDEERNAKKKTRVRPEATHNRRLTRSQTSTVDQTPMASSVSRPPSRTATGAPMSVMRAGRAPAPTPTARSQAPRQNALLAASTTSMAGTGRAKSSSSTTSTAPQRGVKRPLPPPTCDLPRPGKRHNTMATMVDKRPPTRPLGPSTAQNRLPPRKINAIRNGKPQPPPAKGIPAQVPTTFQPPPRRGSFKPRRSMLPPKDILTIDLPPTLEETPILEETLPVGKLSRPSSTLEWSSARISCGQESFEE